jgi:hypothetical protein
MPPPEGTKFPFKDAFKLQAALTWTMRVSDWDDEPIVEARFQSLAKLVYKVLRLKIGSWDALIEQLRPMYGEAYTEQKRQAMAWRLAAATPWLKKGYATKAKFENYREHWVPLLIEDCQYGKPSRRGEARVKVWFRVLAGVFSGLPFTQLWSHRYHVRGAAKEIGFPLYGTIHYRELTSTWLGGLLQVEDPRFPTVVDVYGSSAAIQHNRMLRKEREEECIRDFRWTCYECSVGLKGTGLQDGCHRATHPHTFKQGSCIRCKREDAWFDPGSKSKWCLRCVAREAKERIRVGGI